MNDLQKMKLKLIEQGILTTNMDQEQVETLYREKITNNPLASSNIEEIELKPVPAAPPESATERKSETGAPRPPKRKIKSASPHGALEQAIADIIDDRLGDFDPQNQVDETTLIDLINQHAHKTVTIQIKDRETTRTITGAHKALEDILFQLNNDEHVYLYGPAGSGKTTLAEQAAEALGKTFYKTGAVLMKYELVGFTDAAGVYHTTAFREAYETGSLFLFDEMDSSSAEAILALNDALSNGCYTFPDSPKPVNKGEGFIAIGCANTIGKGATRIYVGRAPLDGASRDRFYPIEIEYDETLERRLGIEAFKQYGGKTESTFNDFYRELLKVRAAVDKRKLSIIISPRKTLRGAKDLAGGRTLEQVRESVLYNEFTQDQRKQVKGSI